MDRDWLKFGNTFCPYPFLHQHIDTRKRKRLCCLSYQEIEKESGFNTEKYKAIRQSMLDGQPVDACSICYEKESRKEISERQKCIRDMKDYDDLLSQQISAHQTGRDLMPYWYDLRFSNNCNLRCQMCSPSNSSSIAKALGIDQPYLTNEPEIDINPGAIRIYMSGGEPFMIKKFVDLLDKIDNEDCEIIVNTNGTIVTDPMMRALSRFRDVCITLSIDGYGDLNDKIRLGSRWIDIDTNIDLFNSKGWSLHAQTVLQNDNVNHLIQLAEYIQSKSMRHWTLLELEGQESMKWHSNKDIKINNIKPLLTMPVVNKNVQTLRILRRVLSHAVD
jgi:sulfatase maturation enzyme AslB (radical SAM superfamily)